MEWWTVSCNSLADGGGQRQDALALADQLSSPGPTNGLLASLTCGRDLPPAPTCFPVVGAGEKSDMIGCRVGGSQVRGSGTSGVCLCHFFPLANQSSTHAGACACVNLRVQNPTSTPTWPRGCGGVCPVREPASHSGCDHCPPCGLSHPELAQAALSA
jgi:hypothetical protein